MPGVRPITYVTCRPCDALTQAVQHIAGICLLCGMVTANAAPACNTGLKNQAGMVVAAFKSGNCRTLASAAPHLRAQLQHKKLVTLTERGSPPACFAECAEEGVEQRKGEWPHTRAPTVESVAALMQYFLALDVFAKR